MEIRGKNGIAKVYTRYVEETAIGQIVRMMSAPITENSQVRIMPDVHAGKGSTIGTSIALQGKREDWKVSPNIVGVDIGCGMLSYKLNTSDLDLEKIDKIISQYIPSGHSVHNKSIDETSVRKMLNSMTFDVSNPDRISKSLGSLGGGNHFIEIAVNEIDEYWLTVHSGSRNLGLQVAQYHQNKAVKSLEGSNIDRENMIANLKSQGRECEIERALQEERFKVKQIGIEKDLAYLTGAELDDYLNDLQIAQKFAAMNRKTMLDIIVKEYGVSHDEKESFDSIHNYMDIETGIIRKGATDASKGVRLIIPLNMRDGSLICVGKGNPDWNHSAPHGAGRSMSRSKAKNDLSMDDYKDQMRNVYTTSVVESTLDEAPGAYKSSDNILNNITDTVDLIHHIKPIYNYKAH